MPSCTSQVPALFVIADASQELCLALKSPTRKMQFDSCSAAERRVERVPKNLFGH